MVKIIILMVAIKSGLIYAADVVKISDDKFNYSLLNKTEKKQGIHAQNIAVLAQKIQTMSIRASSYAMLSQIAEEFHLATNNREKDAGVALFLYLVSFKNGYSYKKANIENLLEDTFDINQDLFQARIKKYSKKKYNKNLSEDELLELKMLIVLVNRDLLINTIKGCDGLVPF